MRKVSDSNPDRIKSNNEKMAPIDIGVNVHHLRARAALAGPVPV